MQWGRSYCLGSLAECYRKVGQLADGLTALTDALGHVKQTEERFYEAELYRLKGELTLQSRVQRRESSVADTRHPIPDTLSSSLDTQH